VFTRSSIRFCIGLWSSPFLRMSRLSDIFNSGWVPDVFEQIVGSRLFGISAFFSRHTDFRVFVDSHDGSCFCQVTRFSVSHGFPCFRIFGVFLSTHGISCFSETHGIPFHTEFRVIGDTQFSVSHGFLCFRIFAFPRNSDCMFDVWSFGRPRTCSFVRALRNIDPLGRHQFCSGIRRFATITTFVTSDRPAKTCFYREFFDDVFYHATHQCVRLNVRKREIVS
jgi:hypothetical protein